MDKTSAGKTIFISHRFYIPIRYNRFKARYVLSIFSPDALYRCIKNYIFTLTASAKRNACERFAENKKKRNDTFRYFFLINQFTGDN